MKNYYFKDETTIKLTNLNSLNALNIILIDFQHVFSSACTPVEQASYTLYIFKKPNPQSKCSVFVPSGSSPPKFAQMKTQVLGLTPNTAVHPRSIINLVSFLSVCRSIEEMSTHLSVEMNSTILESI